MTLLLPAAIGGAILAILGLVFAARERRARAQQTDEQLNIPFPKRA